MRIIVLSNLLLFFGRIFQAGLAAAGAAILRAYLLYYAYASSSPVSGVQHRQPRQIRQANLASLPVGRMHIDSAGRLEFTPSRTGCRY